MASLVLFMSRSMLLAWVWQPGSSTTSETSHPPSSLSMMTVYLRVMGGGAAPCYLNPLATSLHREIGEAQEETDEHANRARAEIELPQRLLGRGEGGSEHEQGAQHSDREGEHADKRTPG